MKGFAIFVLVLAVLGVLIGFLMLTGNRADQADGMALIGSGFMSILLSCAVIALADIRKCLLANTQSAVPPAVSPAAQAAM
jgi:hypothetical protein